MIKISEYKSEDKTNFACLIDELQDYLVELDPLKRLRRLDGYGLNYVNKLLAKFKNNKGMILVARDGDKVAGIITGIIEVQEEDDLLEWIPTVTGRVLDMIVSADYRNKSIGNMLIRAIEDFFIKEKCDWIRIRVLKQNINAYTFYCKHGYKDRLIDVCKNLK